MRRDVEIRDDKIKEQVERLIERSSTKDDVIQMLIEINNQYTFSLGNQGHLNDGEILDEANCKIISRIRSFLSDKWLDDIEFEKERCKALGEVRSIKDSSTVANVLYNLETLCYLFREIEERTEKKIMWERVSFDIESMMSKVNEDYLVVKKFKINFMRKFILKLLGVKLENLESNIDYYERHIFNKSLKGFYWESREY